MMNPRINADGTKRWLNDKGQQHRLDGPAVEWPDGFKSWWINGELQRLDGPAIEHAGGAMGWFVNGIEITDEVKHWYLTQGLDVNIPLNQDDQILLN